MKFKTIMTAAVLMTGLGLGTLQAATIDVTTFDDELNADGDCSLREAIVSANTDAGVDNCVTGSGGDVILLPEGTYRLTVPGTGEDASLDGDLDITSDLILAGAGGGATVMMNGSLEAVLDFRTAGAGMQAMIHNIRITGGENGGIRATEGAQLDISTSEITGNKAPYDGGGLFVGDSAYVTLKDVLIHGNRSTASGGGIAVNGPSNVRIGNSAIVDNLSADDGGGLSDANGARIQMENVTIAMNHAGRNGGGIYTEGTATLDLMHVTLAKNAADDDVDGNGDGGGLFTESAPHRVVLRNTLLGDNFDRGNEAPDCAGSWTSGDYNLVSDGNGCTILGATSHSIHGAVPLLDDHLALNGGLTPTLNLLRGSPAIDAAANSQTSKDQRGFDRPGRGGTAGDIGAFEAFCGDGVISGNEECDGSVGCTAECRPQVSPSGGPSGNRPADHQGSNGDSQTNPPAPPTAQTPPAGSTEPTARNLADNGYLQGGGCSLIR